ncbi:MAG: Mrp/NBP35 family ATP-binding protein [Proteobacteria bacterium]|nr:Mrp/NBP35 family ATP-binding protein [Pseudomonadota bacterium]
MSNEQSGQGKGSGPDLFKKGEEIQAMRENMAGIRNVMIILSGKGGVGKSTMSVNLATALALEGYKVGLLDIDFHGPTVPTMLGLVGQSALQGENEKIRPVVTEWGLKVISLGFFLRNQDDAVIWRGPMKTGVIKQLLREVDWGELDYLLIDCPPGTGDEPLSIIQMVEGEKAAVVVTAPQEVSLAAVRKSVSFCRSMDLPILGIVENMSGYLCPYCEKISDPVKKNSTEELAKKENIPFLGKIPILMDIISSGDKGQPIALQQEHRAGTIFLEMARELAGRMPGWEGVPADKGKA